MAEPAGELSGSGKNMEPAFSGFGFRIGPRHFWELETLESSGGLRSILLTSHYTMVASIFFSIIPINLQYTIVVSI